jgi:hypothetical protein
VDPPLRTLIIIYIYIYIRKERRNTFYACMTLLTFFLEKKKDLKIGFLKYGNKGPPAGPYSYYYIYIYIYIERKDVTPSMRV